MKKNLVLLLTVALLLSTFAWPTGAQTARKEQESPKETENKAALPRDRDQDEEEGEDPDLPSIPGVTVDKQAFLLKREEQIDFLRGLPYPRPDARIRAIYAMKRQEMALEQSRAEATTAATWRPIGPAPIPNGQTQGTTSAVSGRVSAIAIHPTNPNIVYVGTAQGGLYRTLDGGTTWTPLMDGALSLVIGAIAIAPSDPTIVYVGTGESTLSGLSFFGVGIYRITTADTTPVVAGPIGLDGLGNDVFLGRAISEIQVHPTNPNIIFASTTSGIAGISGSQPNVAAPRGLYRSTDALSGSPTFTKLTVATAAGGDRSITDIVMEPGNPNRLIAAVYGLAGTGDGGIYLTTNALDAAPTFTQTLMTGTAADFVRSELAINKVGGVVTVLAATGTSNGQLLKSVDGGATWPTTLTAVNGFCTTQCFYDIAVSMDPTNANVIYLGGAAGNNILKKSTNGGTSFTITNTGLHADSHAVEVAPSDPNIVYFGCDGGIWKSTNAGVNYTSLNNSTFSATQFVSIALHPVDRYFTIGGTQDNGTEFLRPDNTWVRAVAGDGGRTVIDQNATNNVNVTMYHTFFNQPNNQIGFNRITTVNPTGTTQNGSFLGCTGTSSNNGIGCSDQVLFYAPMVRGPGTPNTLYFGTDRLYRSVNQGTTMTVASQTFGARVSAIGISPQNDNVRLVGLTNGQVFTTNGGSSTLTEITGPIPAGKYVARAVFDPNNVDVAYVTLSGFGIADGEHIWKTTNLSTASPSWTRAGFGIPDVPVSAFVIDPDNPSTLYAGTDIGVYRSRDGGQTWTPFSNGLPRIAIFDMEIHKVHRFLRIATHGRGMYELDLRTANSAAVADFDGDGKSDVSVFRPSNGGWYILRSTDNGFVAQAFGQNGDKITPGDFDGDGKTDLAVFRPSDNNWYLMKSSNGAFSATQFGQSADVPVASDYDGDGKTDIAVFRPGDSTWYIQQSTAGFRAQPWGMAGDNPAPGDYDGDGKTDFAVFRPSNGTWYILQSSTGAVRAEAFGMQDDKTVAGDYDGDGKTDLAVFRASNRTWYLQQSTAGFSAAPFGLSTDVPAPGDFDGDGKTDLAVFRPTDGTWYIQQSANGFRANQFGMNGDVPVPAGYVP
ncbi:MAG: VCBS repeat-containing protein [Acidobacteria bacterium]|nr:VCBS repeat-containing protein [Acidobacteriota bacterium]